MDARTSAELLRLQVNNLTGPPHVTGKMILSYLMPPNFTYLFTYLSIYLFERWSHVA